MNQEAIDAARELLAALTDRIKVHVALCTCHRCQAFIALHRLVACETGELSCMCGELSDALAGVEHGTGI